MLKEWQRNFFNTIIGQKLENHSTPQLGVSKIKPEQTWTIYRRNYLEGHIAALTDTYSTVVNVVGADYFRQLARAYVSQGESKSGDLNHYAFDFAAFLATFLPTIPHGQKLPYLPDIARLDLARFEMLCLGSTPIDWAEQLQNIAPSDWPALIATPACRYLRSNFPIYQIWQASGQAGHFEDDIEIDLNTSEAILITCKNSVELTLLTDVEAAFVDSWFSQKELRIALASACTIDEKFDPTTVLQLLVRSGAISHIHIKESLPC